MLLMLVNTRIGKVLALWLRIEAEENIVALLIFICSQLYAQPQVCNNVQWLTGNPDLVQCQLGQWAFSFIFSI